ncbi:MAG: cyclic nucleotide-binding domain-containing protein [Spirochaetales bacterium]|nr:cyclic nucleotide-binding domain-containing protein [Spirochaetales bacterium]
MIRFPVLGVRAVALVANLFVLITAPLYSDLAPAVWRPWIGWEILALSLVLAGSLFRLREDFLDLSTWPEGRPRFWTVRSLDLLTAIPWELPFVLGFMNPVHTLYLAVFLRYFRLFFVLGYLQDITSTLELPPAVQRILNIVIIFAFSAHYIANAWILVTGNPDHFDDVSLYLRALYWTVTTMTTIGYGDITPHGNSQILFVIFIEVFGAGMYGYVIGVVASLISNFDIAKNTFQHKIDQVEAFLRYRKVPRHLQRRVREYFDYLWKFRRGHEEAQIADTLPAQLWSDIGLHLNRDLLERVPLFQHAPEAVLRQLILRLQPVILQPGDIVFEEGEIGLDMYFITKGSVEVVSFDRKKSYAILQEGQYFGEIALLNSVPRTATIIARDWCELYRIDKPTFDRVVERFPGFADEIQRIAHQRRQNEAQRSR